jgi:hypothetical protein|tara:strand:+ start:137 stop:460 length:324 start_codon:yes stop_codon:yes gene_type:complete
MEQLKTIDKYLSLEKTYNIKLSLSHIYILETLLNKPNEWLGLHDFPGIAGYTFSRSSQALTLPIDTNPNRWRQWGKSLYWVDFKTEGKNKKLKLSKKGVKILNGTTR